MGHYASEMGYVSPTEQYNHQLRVEGKCVNCLGKGYIRVQSTSRGARAVCFDCRDKGRAGD